MNVVTGGSHRLDGLFRPESVALVGASENSRWARMAMRNFDVVGYEGRVFPVNRKGGQVFGRKSYKVCVDIGSSVDAAMLLIPATALMDSFDDLAAAGIRNAIILSSGFAETGEEGALLQKRLHEKASDLDITVLGPNCTGYVNYAGKSAMFAGTLRAPVLRGNIALISQSGAIASAVHHFGAQQGIGLSAMIGTGNELNLGLERVLDYFLADPLTDVICVFAETFRNPEGFIRAARKAREIDKPLVVLKVGRNEITAKAAQAHTGALVGDDRAFDAVCRQYGIVRVRSIDELLVTADALAKIGKVQGDSVAIVSISGGVSEITADIASDEGMNLATLTRDTQEKLRSSLPSFATVNNPLDLTGAATTDYDIIENSITIVGSAPEVDLLLYIFEVPRDEDDVSAFARPSLEAIGRGIAKSAKPCIVLPYTMKTVGAWSLQSIAENDLPYVSGGIEIGMPAVARAVRWMRDRKDLTLPKFAEPQQIKAQSGALPRAEYGAQEYLRKRGIPVVPSVLCASAEDAVTAAQKLGGKVVLKIASQDIAHKSDVGGVIIGLEPDAVYTAFEEIIDTVKKNVPSAHIDGVLVSPMRQDGIELLVGVTRDPQWGLMLTVGIGGIFVEILKDASLRPLPVSEQDVMSMLEELRGAKLLSGYRNRPAADKVELARVITKISEVASGAGDELSTMEINPLLVFGSQIEALDALFLNE